MVPEHAPQENYNRVPEIQRFSKSAEISWSQDPSIFGAFLKKKSCLRPSALRTALNRRVDFAESSQLFELLCLADKMKVNPQPQISPMSFLESAPITARGLLVVTDSRDQNSQRFLTSSVDHSSIEALASFLMI